MVVKFWDKQEQTVRDRDEAVQVIKKSLRNKMNKEDKLRWYYSKLFKRSFPTIAVVITKFGEVTDQGAIILENSECY